ncbi:hypothetical protein [Pseudobacteriovorax antillogorgiicola]|uniref:Uncharacterized protein n=1 Tax=Pseudobacteriovorax antillogorgiicola TaxID=1513793 RepID=A0A1Y6CQJ5_9BACT|nr:hypothetical protein [Pseudobacteriovorax antillogorgiicola]TCS46130.1 hypothetical protein EDD56_12531 [Pseudobacteriovorax antillogorgiicola]SMF69620.1 hypothetical protein SAMN06296036_12531 [Pseudobacteriovorax antillogorgiicola]
MSVRINKLMMVIFVLGLAFQLKGSPENLLPRISGAELFLQLEMNGLQKDSRTIDWLFNDSYWNKKMKAVWDKDCYQVKTSRYLSNLETVFRRQKFMEVFDIIKDRIRPMNAEICEASLLEEGNKNHRHYFVVSIDDMSKSPEYLIFETRWSAPKE